VKGSHANSKAGQRLSNKVGNEMTTIVCMLLLLLLLLLHNSDMM